jgi:hypothetical protein
MNLLVVTRDAQAFGIYLCAYFDGIINYSLLKESIDANLNPVQSISSQNNNLIVTIKNYGFIKVTVIEF